MENRSKGPKLIMILLSVLLMTSAVIAAISIDGGKWLTANPVFAQPPEEAIEQNSIVPVIESNSDVDNLDKQYSLSGSGCHHDSATSPSDW